MIQQGVLILLFSIFLPALAGFFSSFQQSRPTALETEMNAITGCTSMPGIARNISAENPQRIFPAILNSLPTEQNNVTTIWLEVVPEQMKFDKDTITVKAGKNIVLELDNLDGMQHNLLILKPNSLDKVGAAADAMLRDPQASEKHYVPDMPEVLFATEMLGPNEVYTLKFTAPSTPGNYPFVCTFPGHWRMMRGIMVVEKL
jgi:azurin